jgi:D-alanyl-D-alanine carboxypeptidase/D-alanyl-D-alanine-endopeptidase (penicillin-binding protein 4)
MAGVLSSLALWHLTLLAGLPLLPSQPKPQLAQAVVSQGNFAQAITPQAMGPQAAGATAALAEPVEVPRGPSLSLFPSGQYQVPLASLPSSPPPLGLPLLQSQVSCPALQRRLQAIVGAESSVWSISVADSRGRLLADVNGQAPRLPASNQKLVSTAFALDRLGPDYHLNTQLWRLGDGSFRLTGEGDPDLALPQLQRFARLALATNASANANSNGNANANSGDGPQPTLLRLQLAEEPPQAWWPQGWNPDDRFYAYGAPVTRLAVTSNAIHAAVANPPARLSGLLAKALAQQGTKTQLSLVSAHLPLPSDAVLVHQEPSAPMHNLLSLANTESHNFTAEVLLRQGAGSWNLQEARRREMQWLAEQGLPMEGVMVADGSGLDRGNRLTSRFLVALLLRMNQHPYANQYLASLAVAGRRGTLRNLFIGTPIEGRLYAKTGTLTGVRSISGVLETADGPRYVSNISNGASVPNDTIRQVLLQVLRTELCDAQPG